VRGEAAAFAFALQNVAVTVGTFVGGLLPALLLRAGFGNVARNRTALLIGVVVSALGLLPLVIIALRSWGTGNEQAATLLGPQLDATPRRTRRGVWGFAGAAQPHRFLAECARLACLARAGRPPAGALPESVEMTIFNKRVPAHAMASAFGLRIAAWNFSWAAISIIAGELIVHGGYNAPLYILAVFTTLGTGLLWYALR
jgi:hypothetical protein